MRDERMGIDLDIPDIVELDEDEKIIHVLHRTYLSFVFPFSAAITIVNFIIVGSIISQLLGTLLPLFGPMFLVVLLGGLFVPFGIIMAVGILLGYFYARGHLYIVTNRRLLFYTKFIVKILREIRYQKITDTVFNQGPFGRILGYSSISVTSPGMEGGFSPKGAITFMLSLKGIKNGLAVRETIIELIDMAE